MIDLEVTLFLCLLTSERGRFWYRVPSKEQGKGPPERTKRAVAVSRTEDASGAAGGCPQSVESAVLRTFEDAPRTREGCFWHRISLPYRRSLFFTPNASEDASRTPGSLFDHGTHIPYHRWPSPVPNARHRQVAAAAEPGVHFSRPPLYYRPHCSVDKPFTGTCGGCFMQWCSTGRPHYL